MAKNAEGKQVFNYNYDSIGNRLQFAVNGLENAFDYNKLNQLNKQGFSYDKYGNMTKTPEMKLKYNLKNRITEITKGDLYLTSNTTPSDAVTKRKYTKTTNS